MEGQLEGRLGRACIAGAACLAVVASLAACTNRQVFEAVRANRRLECEKLPAAQQPGCHQQYETTYTEYERERRKVSGAPE